MNRKLALDKLSRASAMADRISRLRAIRANKAGEAARLGHARNVWSNAMLAYKAGKPWAEVDYSKLRLALRIDSLPSASAIVDRLYSRMIREGRF